uniref:Peptidase A1 domain-containing protein n=1 Tax=Melanopsichium pennsylvanicum 4 TaxID=1398559 RepID=A0A077R2N2_9BASI|nr:hypothetical protein BN887_04368 [Melanopsichium pennsylvanicum 4]
MTAAVAIGTPETFYNLIADTGSPFLVLQNSAFHRTSSTWDAFGEANQPKISGAVGYMTTTPEPTSAGDSPVKSKMHFVIDTACLGQRAGVGSKAGNATLALTDMKELKVANGILGLSPPFDKVGAGFNSGRAGGDGGGSSSASKKSKRTASSYPANSNPNTPPASVANSQPPSQDVSFTHAFFSSEHRTALGMTGSSHFYLALSPSTPSSPLPGGQLVFPLTGTTLPTDLDGYDTQSAIYIGPESGSTFPKHPFWGIAHRPDLKFYLDDKVLDDVKVDAILLDSGTSGIVGPPSEVNKIFQAVGKDRIQITSPKGASKAVLGKAKCGDNAEFKMGFEIGAGKRAGFIAVRQNLPESYQLHDGDDLGANSSEEGGGVLGASNPKEGGDDLGANPSEGGGALMAWKSYINAGVTSYTNGINGALQVFHDWLHPSSPPGLGGTGAGGAAAGGGGGGGGVLGLGLLKRNLHQKFSLSNAPGSKAAASATPEVGGHDKNCEVTLMGSPQVDAMFPSSPGLKIWIVGLEFFQQNLVYHNIDTAVTAIVARKET